MKQILFDKCNFVYDNKPISGRNVIVILENEWVNKNGWVKGRGMGLYLEKNIALFNVSDHLQHFFTLQNK